MPVPTKKQLEKPKAATAPKPNGVGTDTPSRKENDSPPPVQPQQPPTPSVIVNAPNGIGIGPGGTATNPTVNNNYSAPRPPPQIEWSIVNAGNALEGMLQTRRRGPRGGNVPEATTPPLVTVSVKVQGPFYYPLFAVQCDRPCEAVAVAKLNINQNSTSFMLSGDTQFLYSTNRSDTVVAGPTLPVIDRGSDVWICIASGDQAPLNIVGVTPFVRP